MSKLELRKQAWHQQATSEDEKQQVGRLVDDEAWSKLVNNVNTSLELTGKQTILDVGCGNGYLLSQLNVDKTSMYGVDFAENMVVEAKKRLIASQVCQSEAHIIPFDCRFERILCYSIFHYFPSLEYAEHVIEEFIRVAKPGAIILLGDLLDKQFEQQIKEGSDMNIEKQLPIIHRYSQWLFIDIEGLSRQLLKHSAISSVEILTQPEEFKLSWYRKDMKICLV
ncbi:methyltransferase domain-containing protein [Pseudoalteromonas viridis]|uniref:Methyltransferase domain-containing protein n=1 Tax=Pseudoalteromonas viridis TaxID=339617 RepID=A0ABX7V160_9GAMM|nr:methyltransferase domain-containing protein [Pseudoalteromonas viridis]QTL34230.1 methyltransferase domain-containing protein [Pseudoalteromonas viridis]